MDGYLGDIKIFAGNFEPRNWKFCNGQTLDINSYQALYAVIGVTYGGDGQSTFALPDLRDRCAIGAGQGTGLTNRILGGKVGTDSVTLATSQMPAHSHATANNLSGKVHCNDELADHSSPVGNTLSVFKEDRNAFNTQAPDSDMMADSVTIEGTVSIGNAGSGQAHANRQPSLGINHIICVVGIFPPHS